MIYLKMAERGRFLSGVHGLMCSVLIKNKAEKKYEMSPLQHYLHTGKNVRVGYGTFQC